ncbi:MAG: hypothetical protein KDE05_15965 [Parvularculaceae bacterium]|nr:hypothetical protein [Parvularculaceae bacterium]
MRGVKRAGNVVLALLACAACATSPIEERSDALAPFTIALRDSQPDGALAVVYEMRGARLVWIAAEHATRTDSLTFSLINDAYRYFDFDTVIVEGCPASWGANAERLVNYAQEGAGKEKDGFQPNGETVPTVLGGIADGATIYCGEPDDAALLQFLSERGIAAADVLGFYTMRMIPQWIRERQIVDAGDPAVDALLDEELRRNRGDLGLDEDVLATVGDLRRWYEAKNGKALDAGIKLEEVGPLADGPYETNVVGAAISRARAAYLHGLVIDRLKEGGSLLVVFGASHLMIHKPALDASLGEACYYGAALQDALTSRR